MPSARSFTGIARAGLLLIVAFAGSLLACGGREAADGGTVNITYWTHADPNRTALEEELIVAFERAHANIRVKRSTWDSREISGTVLTAFAAQRGPDLFNLQIENAAQYIESGAVVPVDFASFPFSSLETARAAYAPGVLDPVTRNGRLYGVPLELTNWAIFLNRRMFRDAGLDPDRDYPRTWEDMVRVSERFIQRADGRLLRRGFDFRYTDYLIALVPMVEQLGGRLVSPDGRDAIVGEDAWIHVLEYLRDWGPAGRHLGSPHAENARALFNLDRGEVAMAHTGLYQQGRIRAENPEFWKSGDWMVVPFPRFENASHDVASSIYGHYMMVNAAAPAEVQRAAWSFVAFLLEHAERYLEEVSIVQPTVALMGSDRYRGIPFSDVFRQEMERARVVYHGPMSTQLQELVRDAVEAVMFGEVSPQRAYITLRAHARELLATQE